MSIVTSRQQRRELARQNAKQTEQLRDIPRTEWPSRYLTDPQAPTRVMRSREFLVQVYEREHEAVLARLSVCRTSLTGDRWTDGVSWEDLMRLKQEAGYEAEDAVEIYPPALDVVNVANMRHLWVLTDRLPFAWRFRPRFATSRFEGV